MFSKDRCPSALQMRYEIILSQNIIHEGGSAFEERISHYYKPASHETLPPRSSPPATPRFASPPIGPAKVGSKLIYATAIKKLTPSKQQVALLGGRFTRGAEPAPESITGNFCSMLNLCKSGANVMMLAACQQSLAGVTTTIGR